MPATITLTTLIVLMSLELLVSLVFLSFRCVWPDEKREMWILRTKWVSYVFLDFLIIF